MTQTKTKTKTRFYVVCLEEFSYDIKWASRYTQIEMAIPMLIIFAPFL